MISLKHYRNLDLLILTTLVVIAEVSTIMGFRYIQSNFYISFALLVTLCAIIRWGYWGVITIGGAIAARIILYPLLGYNLYEQLGEISELFGVMLLPLMFKFYKDGRKKISENIAILLGYVVLGYVLTIITKTIGMSWVNQDIIGNLRLVTSQAIFPVIIYLVVFVILAKASKEFIIDVEYLIKRKRGKESNDN